MGLVPTPHSLITFREQRRLELDDVAEFAGISASRLRSFESGDREPSRKQLERLASTYGVPLYAFFGKRPFKLRDTPIDFRRKEPRPAELLAGGLRALLSVEHVAKFTNDLATALSWQPKDLVRPALRINSTGGRAAAIREIFDAWAAKRETALGLSGTREAKFMMTFRLFVETQGAIVSINDASLSDYLGFYIAPESALPSIFVNRALSSRKAQLFTLAHEFAHRLSNEEGISNPFLVNNNQEKVCNLFAAEFLAPMKQFSTLVESRPSSIRSDVLKFVNDISSRSLLSRQATAKRLQEGDYISQRQFQSWMRVAASSPKSEKAEEAEEAPPAMVRAPHAKRLGEVGYLPAYLSALAVGDKLIDSHDVRDGAHISETLQKRALPLALKRFRVAFEG